MNGLEVANLYAKLDADVSSFDRGLNRMSKGINAFEQMTIGAFRRVGELAVNAVGKAMDTVADIAKQGIDFNAMEEQASIAFETMLGSAEKAQAFLDDMKSFAKTTPFEYPDLLTASRRLIALGFSADEVLPMLTNVGDAVAGLGGGKEMIDRVTLALGQMKAKGNVQAEEMMQLAENGIAAWDMLAKKIGVDIPTAMKMVEKREVSAAVGISAIMEGLTSDFGGMMEKQSHTWSGMISNLKDSFGILSGRVMKPFFELVKQGLGWLVDFTSSEGFVKGIDRFTERVASGLKHVGDVVNRFRNMFSFELAILTSDNASFSDKLVAIWDMVAQTGLKIWQSLADELAKLLPQWLESAWEWAKGLWEWIKEATPKALEALWEWAKGLWGWLVENLPTWISNLWEWAKATWQWLVEVTPIAIEKLAEWGAALWGWLTTNLPTWIAKLTEWGAAAWQWLVEAIPQAAHQIGAWGTSLLSYLAANSPAWQAKLAEWATAAWTWIGNATVGALLQLGEWATAIFRYLGTNLPGWMNLLLGWGTALVNWIGDAIPQAIGALTRFVMGLRGEGDALGMNLLGQMVRAWGEMLWRWITDYVIPYVGPAFMEYLGAVQAAGKKIWDALGNLVSEWGKTVDAWLQGMGISFVTWKDIAIGSVLAFTVMFWPTISAAFGAVLGAIGSFVAAWAPILALFVGAILAVAALRTAWESDWLGIRTNTLAALEFLGDAFAPLLDTIKQFGGDALSEIWDWVTGNETSFEAVQKIWQSAKEAFGIVFTAISEKLVEWGSAAWEWFSNTFPGAAKAMIAAVEDIKSNWNVFWGVLQPLLVRIQEAWAAVVADWESGNGRVAEALQRAQRVIDGVLKIIVLAFTGFTNNAILLMTAIVQMIEGDWAGAWESIKQIGKNTFEYLTKIVGTAFDAILTALGKNRDDVERWYQSVIATLKRWAGEFRDLGRSIVDGIKSGITSAWSGFTSWLSGMWNALTRTFTLKFDVHSPSGLFKGYGVNLMEGLAKGIDTSAGMVTRALGDVYGGMEPAFSTGHLPSAPTTPAVSTSRIEELLIILIQELRAKNMNVTVSNGNGGGNDYGSLVNMVAGTR